jgi:hypothetical protein
VATWFRSRRPISSHLSIRQHKERKQNEMRHDERVERSMLHRMHCVVCPLRVCCSCVVRTIDVWFDFANLGRAVVVKIAQVLVGVDLRHDRRTNLASDECI